MSRLPFDPEKMKPDPETRSTRSASGRPLSVSAAAAMIDRALRDGLPPSVRVVGEVSGFRDRTHWYFGIKDSESSLSCVMFSSAARKLGFVPEDGQEVVVSGRVEFYARQGRTQVYVTGITPVGAGALDLQFRKLCEALRAEGYFDPEAKRALPAIPRKVAVLTSRTGAALQDVLDTMRRRAPFVEVVLIDVRVQGDGAANEIARSLRWLNERAESLQIDAVILTRGGGSMEDLWAFNERVLADAIFESTVPIVAAIGHETDTTIAELVADERCATPTQAAMRICPDRAAMSEQVEQLMRRLRLGTRRSIERRSDRLAATVRQPWMVNPSLRVVRARERFFALLRGLRSAMGQSLHRSEVRLARLASALAVTRPEAQYANRRARLQESGRRLDRCWRLSIERRATWLDSLARELEIAGPRSVLRRGYSLTMTSEGTIVRSTVDVSAGTGLVTQVADGDIHSVVSDEPGGSSAIRPQAPGESQPMPSLVRRSRRRSGQPETPNQLGLF